MQRPDILDLSAAEAEQQGSSTSFCCKETAIFFSLTNNLKSSMIITMEETLKTRVMLLDQRGDQTHKCCENLNFSSDLAQFLLIREISVCSVLCCMWPTGANKVSMPLQQQILQVQSEINVNCL